MAKLTGQAACHLFFYIVISLCVTVLSDYILDIDTGLGRRFDGTGGLSGGGATSKLLVNYPEPQRSHILDYLFKPNFGASLHVLKVEIGGDSQSTDGTESSHMHTEEVENYHRGYEWWLMVEAKKRNPDIKLYGLPWAWPGWIGEGKQNPYINPRKTASYIVKWVQGAKEHHNLTIDYVGIWNERGYTLDYIVTLRKALDLAKLRHVKIVGTDADWGICHDILKNSSVANAIDAVGVHYPGTVTKSFALETNKALWSSEDYSTFNDNVGAGCWARILNQNYVNGHMTSTISWNLIASYYDDLPFKRSGLMTAIEPWSGHYDVSPPIWISAHTTQFTHIGWHYLQHGSGVGKLAHGGSYVSLICPMKRHLTIVIESMTHDHSGCVRPGLPKYTVKPQNATFILKTSLRHIVELNVWSSKLGFDGGVTELFVKRNPLRVENGTFTISIQPDEVFTLTTRADGNKGQHPKSPTSKSFPVPYHDDFEGYPLDSEAYNFAPQIGVWEIRDSGFASHGQVNAQVITDHPVDWCQTLDTTINIGGNANWTDISLTADIFLPISASVADGVFLGLRVNVQHGVCPAKHTPGIYFAVHPPVTPDLLVLATDLTFQNVVSRASHSVTFDSWFKLQLSVVNNTVSAFVDGELKMKSQLDSAPGAGFVAYGTTNLGVAYFDNVLISES